MPDQPDSLVLKFAESRPDELALVLADANLQELEEVILALPEPNAAVVAARLPSWQLAGLLGVLEPLPLCRILLAAQTDDAVAIVSHLNASRYDAIVEACPEPARLSLRKLFDLPSHTLASLVTTDFIRVAQGTTCGAFAAQLAQAGDTRPRPIVVAGEGNKYLGMLNLEAVLSRRNASSPVSEVISKVEPLSGLTSAESALGSRLWSSHTHLPVVDSRHRLLGVVSREGLQRAAGRGEPAAFNTERLFSELAVGYFNTCARLLETMLSKNK